jgi:hypothetical protein
MRQVEGGGLGIQWGRERTFAGCEATDEKDSSSTRYYDLKRFPDRWPANSVFGPLCCTVILCRRADRCHKGFFISPRRLSTK